MRERDSQSSPDELTATGQFRATPDIAKNTAQFRAFASNYDRGPEQQPWAMRAPATSVVKLAAIVVVVAALLIVAAILVLSR